MPRDENERMMKMLILRNVSTEADFDTMCKIESTICGKKGHDCWQMHPGGLRYDRYLFGDGAMDLFNYGNLLYVGGEAVGYLLAYRKEGEFVLRLLPDREECLEEALALAGGCFEDGASYTTTVNSLDIAQCEALLRHGFRKEEEERYQAVLHLDHWEPNVAAADSEKISMLAQEDFPERIFHAAIPSGSEVTEEMFGMYLASPAYQTALEYVVRDGQTNDFMAFATWWVDEESKTALLEPAACLPAYRRRGVSRRLLTQGLIKLKCPGMKHVFVSTSAGHAEAILLYASLGFVKTGEANIYVKQK